MLGRRTFLKLSAATAALALAGCVDDLTQMDAGAAVPATAEDRKLLNFFAQSFARDLEDSPESMTQIGMKKRYAEWDDYSATHAEKANRDTLADLDFMRIKIDRNALSPSVRVSYDVFVFDKEQRAANYPFRLQNYDISHFEGPPLTIPTLLINQHRIDDTADAEAFIARIAGAAIVIDQIVAFMREQQAAGITLPHFSYALMLADLRATVSGAPFAGKGENDIFASFKAKLGKLTVDEATKAKLTADAAKALTEKFGPAYQRLIATTQEIAATAKTDHGVGTMPNGKAFYEERVANHTTLKMPAQEIHELGLREVARLSAEMEVLKRKLGFRGPLKAFYADLRTNKRYLYPETQASRTEYLARAHDLLQKANAALPSTFGALPKAPVDVKRMEPFMENGQTIALYNTPSTDGSRPGLVYYNLASMATLPKWQMAALTFHEGIPGHHLQISIAQETKNIPEFRKYLFFTAYVEGWALYTEIVAKEMGLYENDLDEVGRITMELWRACRLVVDTGIHTMGWSRKKSVAYFMANTALSRDNIVREIDRYFVLPGQACAYQLGKNKILELREKAKAALGPKFDIRAYHDTVLQNGALPLPVLETIVNDWVRSRATAV